MDGKAWLSFDAERGSGNASDIGMFIGVDSEPKGPIWITNDSGRKRVPRMAAFGDNLLLVWGLDGGTRPFGPLIRETRIQAVVVNRSGKPLQSPEDIPATKRAAAPLFTFPNGDVGWVNDVMREPNQLEIIRISLRDVEPQPAPTVSEVTINPALNMPLLQALYAGTEAQALALLGRGADPNTQYRGWTALMYAAYANKIGVVRALLSRGARVNEGVDGMNALSVAREEGHTEIVALLQPLVQATMRSTVRRRGIPLKPQPTTTVRERSVRPPTSMYPESPPLRLPDAAKEEPAPRRR